MPDVNGKMTREELAYLKEEYRVSKARKTEHLHSIWRQLCAEYRLSNMSFWQFYDAIVDTENQSENIETTLQALDGRVGSINVFVRKWAALMSFQNPDYTVDNGEPGNEPIARLLETAWDTLSEKTKHPRMLKKMLMEAALTGTAVVKAGYRSQYVYSESPVADDSVPEGVNDDFLEDAMPDPELTEWDTRVVGEHPSATVVRAYDIFYDNAARVLDEVRFIFHRTSRVVRDVQLDVRYDAAVRKDIRGQRHQSMDESTYPAQIDEIEAEMRRVDVIECYNVQSKQYCVFAEEPDMPLRHWTRMTLPVDNPYTIYQPIPDPESCWGIPYALLMYPQAMSRNRLSAVIVDKVARHAKTVNLVGNEFAPETISAINNAQDGDCIQDPNMNSEQIRNAVTPVSFGTVNPDVLSLRSMIENDQSFMSGLSDPTTNIHRGVEQTATEVQNRTQGQSLTIDDMRTGYEEAAEDVAVNLFKIMLDNWDETKLVKYVGNDPRMYFWTRLERDKVLADFTLKVKVGSTQKVSPEVRRKHMIDAADRIVKLEQAIMQQKQMEMQTGVQSPVNLEEYLRVMMEEIDPRLADKILNRRDPASLLGRLVGQQILWPANVSPDLLNILGQQNPELATELGWVPPTQPPMPMGRPPMPMAGGTFEEQNRVPMVPMPNPMGQLPMETPAGVSGRALSETFA